MTWRSFVDFWIMREMGHTDATMRAYVELREDKHHDNIVYVNSALHRMGLSRGTKQQPAFHHNICEVIARLRSMGYRDAEYDKVRIRLNQWYVWDTIRTGDRRRFPKANKGPNPLLD